MPGARFGPHLLRPRRGLDARGRQEVAPDVAARCRGRQLDRGRCGDHAGVVSGPVGSSACPFRRVDQATHNVFFPLQDISGHPVVRVMQPTGRPTGIGRPQPRWRRFRIRPHAPHISTALNAAPHADSAAPYRRLGHRPRNRRLHRPRRRTATHRLLARFHDLRHATASWLIHGGANPLEVAAKLRHSRVTTTLATYGHLFPGTDERLDGLLEETYSRASLAATPLA